jgi:hypothetical protein
LLDGVVIGGSAVLPLVVNEATKRPPSSNGDSNNSGSNHAVSLAVSSGYEVRSEAGTVVAGGRA